MNVLFVIKKNGGYGSASGLFNSTSFISDYLSKLPGVKANVVVVDDNNDIDREVVKHGAQLVIIEALWVVPEKFEELQELHPGVAWWVHLHSELPFLSLEGIAVQWITGYIQRGVQIISNSDRLKEALDVFIEKGMSVYLPNIYPTNFPKRVCRNRETVEVVSLGAVRPMKNQLIQALAAIKFSQNIGKNLLFGVNGTRSEGGEQILKNLRSLFKDTPSAQLVELDWLSREDLIKMITFADMGLQLSMSETFNVVAADYAFAGIPMVVSSEIRWASGWSKCDPTDLDAIVKKMHCAYRNRWLVCLNRRRLASFSDRAKRDWKEFLT